MNRVEFTNILKALIKHQTLQVACILVLFLVIFYRDVVLYGRTFLMETAVPGTMPNAGPYNYHGRTPGFVAYDGGAIAWYKEPFNRFVSESVKKGDFPLWNPYAGLAGSPLLADGQTGTLEPIQFLFFLAPDRFWPYAVDLQLLIRFFIAGFSCYLFAKRQRIDFLGSISASVLFMLSSYFVVYGNHPQIKVEVLLPLVLYGYDRLVNPEDRPGLWMCALFVGWVIIAAMPESTFFALFLGTSWYFYKSFFRGVEKGKILVSIKDILSRYLRPTLLGFLISGAYFLPFVELVSLARSIHSPGVGGTPLPIWALPNLLLFQPQVPYLTLGFFAIFSLIFCVLHLRNWPEYRQAIAFFSLYAAIFMLTIFDFPLTNWIRALPVFNQLVFTKYPVPSIVFCLALLVGILVDRAKFLALSNQKILWSILIAGAIFIGLPLWANSSQVLSLFEPNTRLNRILLVFITGIIMLLFLLAYLYRHRKINPLVLQISLLILIASEPFFWSMSINRPDRVDPYQTPPFVKYLGDEKEPFRIFGLDGTLYPNISTAYHLADIRWLAALVPQRTYNFSAGFIESNEVNTIRLTGTVLPVSYKMFSLLNVKYILSENSSTKPEQPGQVPRSYQEVYRDSDVLIYQNKDVLPRAFAIYNIVNVASLSDSFAQLANPNIDLKQTAIVENLPVELANSINKNDRRVYSNVESVTLISSGELDVEVNMKAPGLLVVTDQYYPGWEAIVNGKQVPIYAVDGIFRGIFLDEGNHMIKFKYRPLSFLIGGMISIISLMITITLMIFSSRTWQNHHD